MLETITVLLRTNTFIPGVYMIVYGTNIVIVGKLSTYWLKIRPLKEPSRASKIAKKSKKGVSQRRQQSWYTFFKVMGLWERFKLSWTLHMSDYLMKQVRVWLPIRAQNIKQNGDILGANLLTFHLDPSIVQRFAPFLARISVLVFLCLEWKYNKLYFFPCLLLSDE